MNARTVGNTLNVSTPNDFQIVMTRHFDAPRHLVWNAMTRPELLRRWLWAPEGWEMITCDMDVRVGGKFTWTWAGPDGKPALTITGEHRVVDGPIKIVHTEQMRMGCEADAPMGELVATTELIEQDGGTLLRMTLDFNSKAERDGALKSGMEHGVSKGYDRLDSVLAECDR